MRSILTCVWLTLAFTACATGPQKSGPGTCDLGGRTQSVVPFEFDQNHIYIKASIDGHGPYLFALDSAAGHLIDLEVSESLKLNRERIRISHGYGDSEIRVTESHDHDIQIGDLHLTHQMTYLADLGGLKKAYTQPSLAGTIGRELFRNCVVSIDYRMKQLILQPFGQFHYQGNGQVLPLSFPIPNPVIATELDGVPTPLEVDTGDGWSVTLYRPWVEEHEIRSKYLFQKEVVTGHGLGGPLKTWIAQGQMIRLGTSEVRTPWIRTAAANGGDAMSRNEIAGAMGNGILKHFRVFFDYAHRQLILEPNETVSTDAKYEVPKGVQN